MSKEIRVKNQQIVHIHIFLSGEYSSPIYSNVANFKWKQTNERKCHNLQSHQSKRMELLIVIDSTKEG